METSITLDYTLEMMSDFHIGSGLGIGGLVDRAVVRLANGELTVPGSTIKGRIRHHAEQIVRLFGITCCGGRAADAALCKPEDAQAASRDLCLICRLFGSEWRSGTLRFSDARLIESLRELVYQAHGVSREFDNQVTYRQRTRINRILRCVEGGALFTFEEGRMGLAFEGRIAGSMLCIGIEEIPIPLEILTLVAALQLVECLGGKKTVGLGASRMTVKHLTVAGRRVEPIELNEVFSQYLEDVVLYDEYRNS